MEAINPEFIERYQKMYEKDPNSRIFAPLAEAYRKLGLTKEALEVAQLGVKKHPNFSGGRVALGRIYLELKKYPEAEKELRAAVDLSPENILAHTLLAESLLQQRRPKDALRAYKMLLFLNPDNEKAKRAVQKLESLTADEFEAEAFEMKPLDIAVKEWDSFDLDWRADKPKNLDIEKKTIRNLERVLSLCDAYIVRNDSDKAIHTLNEAERLLGPHPEIVKRLKILHQRQLETVPHPTSTAQMEKVPSRQVTEKDNKIEFLQDLLGRIKNRQS